MRVIRAAVTETQILKRWPGAQRIAGVYPLADPKELGVELLHCYRLPDGGRVEVVHYHIGGLLRALHYTPEEVCGLVPIREEDFEY